MKEKYEGVVWCETCIYPADGECFDDSHEWYKAVIIPEEEYNSLPGAKKGVYYR